MSSVLLEGGVHGHMSHLYDNYDLTFSTMKKILIAAAQGELEGTEKTDGQNLYISYDVKTGKAKGARNKGDIKAGGVDAAGLAQRFGGRGALEFTFSESLAAFEKAVQTFSKEQQIRIFGPDVNIYYNCEIQDPRTANVINYDTKSLSIHRLGGAEFDRATGNKMETDVSANAEALEVALSKTQKAEEGQYRVEFDAIRRLEALSDESVLNNTLSKLEDEMSDAGISDNQTIADYLIASISKVIDSQVELPEENKIALIKRILGVSKGEGVKKVQIVKNLDPDVASIVLSLIDRGDEIKTLAIYPIEDIIHDFAVEMLKTLESLYVLNNKKEVRRLRAEVSKAITAIESSGNVTAMEILKKQMEKLKSVENISTAAEGFVFSYDGYMYKFTGNFAPVNQLLGLFKYGRGNVPPMQKVDESQVLEIVTDDEPELVQTVAVFPGSFKPPHKGHMAVVEYLADRFDKVIVFVSDPKKAENIRMNLPASKSAEIFNLYIAEAGLADKAVAQASLFPTPIAAAFDYAVKEKFDPPAKVYFATSEKDADRYPQTTLDKQAVKNPTLRSLHSITLPAITGPQGVVSAKQLRAIIADADMSREEKRDELVNYIPDYLDNSSIDMLMNILMPEEIAEMSGMAGGAVQGFAGRKEELIEEILNYLLGKAGK
jgi:cytidyltransferase-like protein